MRKFVSRDKDREFCHVWLSNVPPQKASGRFYTPPQPYEMFPVSMACAKEMFASIPDYGECLELTGPGYTATPVGPRKVVIETDGYSFALVPNTPDLISAFLGRKPGPYEKHRITLTVESEPLTDEYEGL